MSGLTGQQWGKYRLQRLLGQGGFAEVYLAEHIYLGLPAAVKILHTVLSSEDIEGFRQEARVIANLTHPHIIGLRDFDLQNGRPFLVLEYAPGGTLGDRHPRGTRVPLPAVLSYVSQVSQAIQYAHDRKLIHRDIKPVNMLLGRNDQVLLSDFGIVAVVHETSSLKTTPLMGTLAYIAPEQIQGHPQLASDQYALGVVVYQWLTGSLPFRGTSIEIIGQHLQMPPQPLRELEPNVPPAIEATVLRALSKNPRDRFASVAEFAQTLQDASLISATPPALASTLSPLTSQTAEDQTAPRVTLPPQATKQLTPASGQATRQLTPVSQQSTRLPVPLDRQATRQLSPTSEPMKQLPLPGATLVLAATAPRSRFWSRLLLILAALVVLLSVTSVSAWITLTHAQQQAQLTLGQNQATATVLARQTAVSATLPATASAVPTATHTRPKPTATHAPTPTATASGGPSQQPPPVPTSTPTPTPTPKPTLFVEECLDYNYQNVTCNVISQYGDHFNYPAGTITPDSPLVTYFTNKGNVTVTYTVTTQIVTASNPNWISASPTSGTLAPGQQFTVNWIMASGVSINAGQTYETIFTVSFSYHSSSFYSLSYDFLVTGN